MKKSAPSKPPKHLSPEARRWWRELANAFEIEDEAGLLMLGTAMEAFDRLREAQGIVAAEGIVITDRFGQKKQHPATLVERDARTAMLRSLKSLNLDIQPPGPIGRPSGN